MEILTTIFGLVVIFLWAELHEAIRTRNFKDFGLIHIKLFRDILIDKDGREKLNKKREKALIRKGLIKDPPQERQRPVRQGQIMDWTYYKKGKVE